MAWPPRLLARRLRLFVEQGARFTGFANSSVRKGLVRPAHVAGALSLAAGVVAFSSRSLWSSGSEDPSPCGSPGSLTRLKTVPVSLWSYERRSKEDLEALESRLRGVKVRNEEEELDDGTSGGGSGTATTAADSPASVSYSHRNARELKVRDASAAAEDTEGGSLDGRRCDACGCNCAGVGSPPILSMADAVSRVMDSVVGITVEVDASSYFTKKTVVSSGSGFFISDNGHILTNAHVVADMEDNGRLSVQTIDGFTYSGHVHSLDTLSDLAIVKIDPDPSASGTGTGNDMGTASKPRSWKKVEFGHQEVIRVGDFVVAIGNPMGLNNTATSGIVSYVGRKNSEIGQKDTRLEFIQTDCTIHFGSSGGPLVNHKGQVIGVNTTRAELEGISFAIRIDNAVGILHQLITRGRVIRPWLGLRLISLSPVVWHQIIEKGLVVEDILDETNGVLVTSVFDDSPAEKGGCKPGDVIVSVNGHPVTSTQDIFKSIGFDVGSSVRFTVKRLSNMGQDAKPGDKKPVLLDLFFSPEELDVFVNPERNEYLESA